jgi:predicted nucleic acid-binding protein
VIVLDAYALAALLADEPAAAEVEGLIAETSVAVPAPNLAETVDRLCRVHGISLQQTRSAVEWLEQTVDLEVRPIERRHAWQAAALRSAHYHRTKCPLSLADCLLLASVGDDERLATSDGPLLRVAEAERIARIALPDSRGRRYQPRR